MKQYLRTTSKTQPVFHVRGRGLKINIAYIGVTTPCAEELSSSGLALNQELNTQREIERMKHLDAVVC